MYSILLNYIVFNIIFIFFDLCYNATPARGGKDEAISVMEWRKRQHNNKPDPWYVRG
jgi:hypothetical protein